MSTEHEIIDVDVSNIDETGFFCYMSKRKSPGYRKKREWLEKRFTEGLKIKMVHEIGGRTVGFIEYIPGEYAWRAVHAPGYLVIHCLWVVGKGKGKGYGARLIEACLEDARQQGKQGVAMVSSDRVWLAEKKIFLHNGFEEIEQSPPSFQLLVHRFADGPEPCFPQDWEDRQADFGPGLTVVRTAQCPYIEDATTKALEAAEARGLASRIVVLESAREVQETAPSPYGVFSLVFDGQLLAYHYVLPKDFDKLLEALN